MINSVRSRLVVGFAVLFAAALTAYGLIFYSITTHWIAPDALAVARDKTVRFGRWVKPDPLHADDFLRTDIRNEAQGYHWAVLDSKGNLVQKSRMLPEVFPLPAMPDFVRDELLDAYAAFRQGTDGERYAVAWYPLFVIDEGARRARITGWTEAVIPMKAFDDRRAQLRIWLTVSGVALFLAVGGLAAYLTELWLRPWRVVAETTRRFGEGDLSDARLPIPGDDPEIAAVAREFNQLIDRVNEVHARQHQFIADASHELRTPLAALRAEIEVALRRERAAGDYQQTLTSSRQELERLSGLVENLLAMARLDSIDTRTHSAAIDLSVICRDVAEQLSPLAAQQNVRLQLELPDQLIIHGDAVSIERAIRNLVENALHHTPAGEHIVIRVGRDKDEARVEIVDAGVGIAADHLPRLFDRFYRVDTARTRSHGGAGLGLAIVKAIADSHGGKVEVQSVPGAGSTFTLRLPLPA